MIKDQAPSVLLVDDEAGILETLSDILSGRGYRLTTASTGSQALSLARSQTFDASIVDQRLPDITGLELLRKLRAIQPALEHIVLTGFPSPQDAARSPRLGAFAYLAKPVDPELLIDTLESALEKRQLWEANRRSLEELSTLYGLASAVNQTLDVREVLERALQEVRRLLQGVSGGAYLWVAPGRLQAVSRRGLSLTRARRLGALFESEAGLAALVQSQEPQVVDGEDWPGLGEVLPPGCRLVIIPLTARGRLHGHMMLASSAELELPWELLRTVGGQVGGALENARLYESLREERDRFLEVEEEIRKKLARDLHAGPAQLLAASLMSARLARQLIDSDPSLAVRELQELEKVADKALHQVRGMLFELRPVILETYGLQAALKELARRLQADEELEVELHLQGLDGRLPVSMERAIYSVVQEAVANVRKHAQASRVRIGLERRESRLTVSVEDDGVGFHVKRVERSYGERRSLGLLDMKERAQALDGSLSIHSKPGQGTRVVLSLRLSEARPQPRAAAVARRGDGSHPARG